MNVIFRFPGLVKLAECKLDVIPSPGEIININGNPYVVLSKGMALCDGDSSEETYIYIEVVGYFKDARFPES